jgi:SAM-dependent methyltransferase
MVQISDKPLDNLNYLAKLKNIINSRILKRWANSSTKKRIWEDEFARGQWNYLDHTDDIIYDFLDRYINKGCILDLGCGTGNTGIEMDATKYDKYTGVDISEVAIAKAKVRSVAAHRQEKNEFVCADISRYAPSTKYDIVLFRESIFYFPRIKIKNTLRKYSSVIKIGGVFIVRMHSQKRYKSIIRLITKYYEVIDRSAENDDDVILVFKNRVMDLLILAILPLICNTPNEILANLLSCLQ